MLHIVNSADDRQPPVLAAMFAARKRVFVDLLKWDVPVLDGRFEVDQFDDRHATYLVLADDVGRHLGSARLLPTTRPHILDSVFPELCADTPPRGTTVREITRFCLDRDSTARERRMVRDTLVCALVDHALAQGITAYSAVAELGWYSQILAFGWHCRPLGVPVSSGSTALAALAIEIDAGTPALLARAGLRSTAELLGDHRVAA